MRRSALSRRTSGSLANRTRRSRAPARRCALARRLDAPFSMAFALFFETIVHSNRRDVAAQRERAAEVVALSEMQGFPLFLGLGRAYPRCGPRPDGRSRCPPRDDGRPGARSPGRGTRAGAPGSCAMSGRSTASRRPARRGAGHGRDRPRRRRANRAARFDADLHRLDGDLLLATGGAADEAAARYHRALAIAREQGRARFELRAATSLARLWRDQGKRAEAARPARPGLRAGSPKASTRATSSKRRHCWRSSPDDALPHPATTTTAPTAASARECGAPLGGLVRGLRCIERTR